MNPTERFVLSLLGPLPERPAGVDWGRAEELLRFHRLGPLAVAEDRAAGGALLPDELRESLEPAYRTVSLTNTLLMEAAGRAREALREAGIPVVIFKGGALLESGAYGDPGARPMDDVDLLVPPERAGEAVRTLEASGFAPWEEWSPEKTRWVDAAAFTAAGSPPGISLDVDLHWRTEYGGLRFGDPGGGSLLWERRDEASGLPAPEAHLVVIAEHVLKHVRYLVHFHGLADATRVAGRVDDWDRVVELAAGRRASTGIGIILGLVGEELSGPIPATVARRLRPGTPSEALARKVLEPRRLLGRLQPLPGRVGGLVLRALVAGSTRRAVGELAGAAFPDEGWLRARYDAGAGAGPDGGEARGDGSDAPTPLWRLRLRYLGDAVRWLGYRGRSPASPNQRFYDPGARR